VLDDPEAATYEDLDREIICAQNDDASADDLPETVVE
jgi:hypothetical protein